ncbi:hypothetical protein F5X99DRAFT_282527 [Biscogniauxia marginata]|nr:hypothetical protein F5X99DRAFT_282527 [Biscogniauxia marginata]
MGSSRTSSPHHGDVDDLSAAVVTPTTTTTDDSGIAHIDEEKKNRMEKAREVTYALNHIGSNSSSTKGIMRKGKDKDGHQRLGSHDGGAVGVGGGGGGGGRDSDGGGFGPRDSGDDVSQEEAENVSVGDGDGDGIVYKVYKRRWFGLAQLTLLNVIVSWDS